MNRADLENFDLTAMDGEQKKEQIQRKERTKTIKQ